MEQGKTMANIEVRLSTGSITSTNVDSPNKSIGGKMAQTARLPSCSWQFVF